MGVARFGGGDARGLEMDPGNPAWIALLSRRSPAAPRTGRCSSPARGPKRIPEAPDLFVGHESRPPPGSDDRFPRRRSAGIFPNQPAGADRSGGDFVEFPAPRSQKGRHRSGVRLGKAGSHRAGGLREIAGGLRFVGDGRAALPRSGGRADAADLAAGIDPGRKKSRATRRSCRR